jgi:uncharacterized protein YigE (DUF2233 family)
LIAVAGLITFLYFDSKLSLLSNLVYLEFGNTTANLEVRNAVGKWVRPDTLNSEAFENILNKNVTIEGEGMTWRTFRLRRTADNRKERIINSIVGCETHVIEFDPEHFEFFPWFEINKGKFEPQTHRKALQATRKGRLPRFVINANYYNRKGQPLGWIVKDGKTIRKQWKTWSGFFFVKDGIPRFGPRSLLESSKGELTHALQGYPSVMKDGTVGKYGENDNGDSFFNGSELNFRSLAGVNAKGHCVFIVSGRGGLMTIEDVTQIARLAGIRDATLLDGGKALQYGMAGEYGSASFHSYNNELPEKMSKGRLTPQQPPVFLVVRRKE